LIVIVLVLQDEHPMAQQVSTPDTLTDPGEMRLYF